MMGPDYCEVKSVAAVLRVKLRENYLKSVQGQIS